MGNILVTFVVLVASVTPAEAMDAADRTSRPDAHPLDSYPSRIVDRPLTLPPRIVALSSEFGGRALWLAPNGSVGASALLMLAVSYGIAQHWEVGIQSKGFLQPLQVVEAGGTYVRASHEFLPDTLSAEIATPVPWAVNETFLEGLAVSMIAKPRFGASYALNLAGDLLFFGSGTVAPRTGSPSGLLSPEFSGVRQSLGGVALWQLSNRVAIRLDLPSVYSGVVFRHQLSTSYFGVELSPTVGVQWSLSPHIDIEFTTGYRTPSLARFDGGLVPSVAEVGVDPSARWGRDPSLVWSGWSELRLRAGVVARF